MARVDGYIQDHKVSSPGEQVNAGQPLVTIYSPDLRSTEQELVNLLNERDRGGSRASLDQVIESSKQRLRQWNVSDQEINALEKSRKARETLVLRSLFTGVIEDVSMKEGMSVKRGDRLIGVIDLSRLWLWADFTRTKSDSCGSDKSRIFRCRRSLARSLELRFVPLIADWTP